MPGESHDSYVGVQILRGVAALLVVVFHTGLLVHDRFPVVGDHMLLEAGAGGVDVFFPISGFVIMVSGSGLVGREDGWRSFLWRRLVRIVPLYWAVTSLKLLAVTLDPGAALHTRLGTWHVIASYLFMFAPAGHGAQLPIVPVGWTLNFEMFFYAIFAATLAWRQPVLPRAVTLVVAAAVLGPLLPEKWGPLSVLNPLVLEFAAGMVIAGLTMSGRRLGRRTAALLLVAAFAVLIGSDALPMQVEDHLRLLLWGVPGAAIVLAAVSLEPVLRRCRFRLPRLIGDASYAIYLSHGFVLPLVGLLAVKCGLTGWNGAAITLGAAVIASIAAGVVAHIGFERPVTQRLRQALSRGAVAAPTAISG